jgi:alkylation response protein AidB-like acyl-CoA dehydrogenase
VLALPALPPDERARVAAGEARWSAEVAGLVPDLGSVERVVTDAGAAPAAGEVLETLDPTRRLGRLAPGPRTPLPGRVDLTRAHAALAAEAVGVARRALELGVEHARTRTQFGRAIGAYQAVAHPLADSYADVELAESLAYWAAWSVDGDPAEAPRAAAAAKAFAAEAAVAACERAIQVHGGTGFTWEHPLQRYYRRAQWIEAFGGYPSAQLDAIAASLLDGAGA